MKIAVAGCIHGNLKQLYLDIEEHDKSQTDKVDLLLVCGDFQTVRNENDLKCMSVPEKYKCLGDFHEYFTGKKYPYVLTIFIGGNHEASNYLQTFPYGGWVAKNIYYLGYANVIKFNGLRIGGISGIYYERDKDLGHFEKLPFNQHSLRSIYHTRSLETFRMLQIRKKLDIMITHDWPLGMANSGNTNYLIQRKPFLKKDIIEYKLGSPMHRDIFYELKPSYWFSAHLHVRYKTTIKNNISEGENKSEFTCFLALDKCLPRRKYLEIMNIESDKDNTRGLEYDEEWLAILRLTNHMLSINNESITIPKKLILEKDEVSKEIDLINKKCNNNLTIPNNFEINLPIKENEDIDPSRKNNYVNKQTTDFCNLFNLDDPLQLILQKLKKIPNPDEINISSNEESNEDEKNEDEHFLKQN